MQQKDNSLKSLISKRQSMIGDISSANIKREDSDIEQAARLHRSKLVEKSIPESITRLEQRRAEFKSELELYVKEHATELLIYVESFDQDILKEQRIVEKLSRELQRGYTTKEVVEKRISNIEALKLKAKAVQSLIGSLNLQTNQEPKFIKKIVDIIDDEGILKSNNIPEPQMNNVFQNSPEIIVTPTENAQQSETVRLSPADAIPSIIKKLDHIESMHVHKYDQSNTVNAKLEEASKVKPEDRTEEQAQLITDIEIFKKYSSSSEYKTVYSPAELHQLIKKLELLSQKQRPDFHQVEDLILSLNDSLERSQGMERSKSLDGKIKRSEKNAPNRIGMNWDSLITHASEASLQIDIQMQEKGSADMQSYFVKVSDPETRKYPDLSLVYQLVADQNALDIIGSRSVNVNDNRDSVFVNNCTIINTWFAESKEIISQIPEFHNQKAREMYNLIKAKINIMNVRLGGRVKSGINKDYRMNAGGAISLQKKIAYEIEGLKNYINNLANNTTDESEIVPLD